MIAEPYKILGISSNASDDEVKRAYRDLSRKYHPDSYVDNPLSDLAEEKFKEVQEAYKQIMAERERGYNSSFERGSYSQSSSSSYGNDSEQLMETVNYLNAGQYHQALNVLSRISNRDARWYYYSAVANYGMNNKIVALNQARQATSMDPSNGEYRAFLNRIQNGNIRYQNTGCDYGRRGNTDIGDLCCKLWCADSLCECMGGDLISCC